MTYDEAVVQSEKQSWKLIFKGKNYLPHHLPIEKVIPAPKDSKRQMEFIELYRHNKGDWSKAARHFVLEEFVEVFLFSVNEGVEHVSFPEFMRLNKIYF